MTIKKKLMVTILLIGAIPMLVSVAVGTWVAKNTASDLLVEEAEKKLISLREFRKQSLEEYISALRKQIITLASTDTVIDATNHFSDSYRDVAQRGIKDFDKSRAGLKDYYNNQFGTRYKSRNPENELDFDQLLTGLDDNTIAMQALYISENPNPLGAKEKLLASEDKSTYSIWHRSYHEQFRHFLETYGYYDIFIVHPITGDIIYSVFKELDYGTSLLDGPYADSGIGEAFRAANQAEDKSFTYLTDLDSYTPSYEDPAIFISTPIFTHIRKVGVLIFQLPTDRLSAITTNNHNWQRDGLGETGEVLIVGEDKRVRSAMRARIEKTDQYLLDLQARNVDPKTINTIAARQSSVLLHEMNSTGIDKALAGESGFEISTNDRNERVLSAYAKLDIPGVDWAIISNIDEEEAFAPASFLSQSLLYTSTAVAGAMLSLVVLLGIWFTLKLTNPIKHLEEEIGEIELDSDLSRRLTGHSGAVTSGIADSLNNMLEKLHGLVQMVANSSISMAAAASDMQDVSKLTNSETHKQKNKTDEINLSMEKMAHGVDDLVSNADEAHKVATGADVHATEGNNVVMTAVNSITKLADDIQRASEVTTRLSNESKNIDKVLDVIRDIAEQTNLLALNAAIEAARAGDKGRGFAVVADEVRTLAFRTQDSTAEIQSMIEGLQSGAMDAVSVMVEGQKQAAISVDQANKASTALKQITTSVTEIKAINENIAAASHAQKTVADGVTSNVSDISQISDSTTSNAEKSEQASVDLNQLAKNMQAAVSAFKL